jgi:tetratricopeptide (TPR) repeat protein
MNTIATTNWDEDVQLDAAETYQALVRSLDLTEGFGIFLVRCVEGERDRLIDRLQKDLPQQAMAKLKLETALEDGNLYNLVAAQLQVQPDLDVLFIDGLEKSFEAYIKPGYGGQGDYYKLDSVPRVLGHLNLQRERFRNDFPVSLVFFMSPFGLKYMARRSPDFFDWRSGIFEFVADQEMVESLAQEMYGDYDEYLTWSNEQRLERIREIQCLLEEDHQTSEQKANLAFLQGILFSINRDYFASLLSYDHALQSKPDMVSAWTNRGISLANLGRYEEAIQSYKMAIEYKPNHYIAWNNQGNSLLYLGQHEEAISAYKVALNFNPDAHEPYFNLANSLAKLGRYEEALRFYDQAIQHKPDDYEGWNDRGVTLANLGRYKEAIEAYEKAIEINPEAGQTWANRSLSLARLGRYEEAVVSCDSAIKYTPTQPEIWVDRAMSLFELGQYKEAIKSLDEALKYQPDDPEAWYGKGNSLAQLGSYEEAILCFAKAIEYNPDVYEGWHRYGHALIAIGRYQEAVAAYQRAMILNPDSPDLLYDFARVHSLMQDSNSALKGLAEAIRLDSEKYRNRAKTDSHFDGMRDDPRFQALLEGELSTG